MCRCPRSAWACIAAVRRNSIRWSYAPKAGLDFGFPYCHQGDVTDPQFGAERACATTEPPVQQLGAHVAAIGFTFYTGSMFPASSTNAAIIAEHGNRLIRVSYAQ